MKLFLSIMILACSAWCQAGNHSSNAPDAQAPASQTTPPAAKVDNSTNRQGKSLIEKAIEALGGQAYLTIRDREMEGRGYTLHHGRQTGPGTVFWSFSEFPDKERVELTKERDITELYIGEKGYEITYKGVHPVEEKELIDYMRRRHYSLDTILRNWVNDPTVVILYEGNAIAAQHTAERVTLINAKNESVSLFFDMYTHLPVKKSFEWRDPIDRQKNLEEEIYDNYRKVEGGILAPYNVSRYFNGDMSSQRFLNAVTINQGLDETMFDPNSGYNPNKPQKKPH